MLGLSTPSFGDEDYLNKERKDKKTKGKKEGRKERRKEGKKEGRKEGREGGKKEIATS